ncbi:MAG: GNAT family N-acetyltransferase [Proteobacteria bacterium]|nr:GNAT family N-acetyltransferase [Pseudomonadota bacterium]
MTIQIKKLKECDLDNLYSLLKQTDFPHLPSRSEAEAELRKKDNHIYLGFDSEDDMLALFLCFSERNDKLYFDIACNPRYQKKWASKKVIKFIFETAFKTLGHDEFIVESLNENARSVVRRFGFEKVMGNFYTLNVKAKPVEKYLK